MVALPSGTITFLFTDIDTSLQHGEMAPAQAQAAYARQEAILREIVEANGGMPYKVIGRALQSAFPTAPQALQAALQAQRMLQSEQWPPEVGTLRVRMALHTGVLQPRGNDYFGPILNRVSRLLYAAHGGQTLLTGTTAQLVQGAGNMPEGVMLRDLGEHRLRDLVQPEHIYQAILPDMQSDFPPLKTSEGGQHNLPVQPTPLIGRQEEMTAIEGMLAREDVQLVTMTGPGGIGKTRLAIQVAADMRDAFKDGVFFVPLAATTEPDMVLPTVSHMLGLQETGDRSIMGNLQEYLRDKQLLLLLDNFEQLVEAAPSIAELLASAPKLKVLVTSRAALHLSVEHQYQVPPLLLPDLRQIPSVEKLSQYEAVALFIERAVTASPGFEVNNMNAPAVAQICVRLDGLPLAIELAAARVKILSPEAILGRLDHSLKLLTGGARDLPARQQTLRSTIEWSYELLSDEEKQLFRRLSLFAGGATLEAIEAVSNAEADDAVSSVPGLELDVLDGVSSLVDKSLVRQVESGGEPRFVMLETIREYASEKLQESGEREALERAHANFFMSLAEEAEPELTGAKQQEWLEKLEAEHDNIRAALYLAAESGSDAQPGGVNDVVMGLRTAGAIWRFWVMRGYYREGRDHLARLREAYAAQSQATTLSQEEVGAQPYIAKAVHGQGVMVHMLGDVAAASPLYEAGLALNRELGNKLAIAASLNSLGNIAYERGDYSAAQKLHEESLVLKREIGDKRGIAISLTNLGNIAYEQGDYATSARMQEESLVIMRELGDKWNVISSLTNLGNTAHAQQDYDTAIKMHEESLELAREMGDKWGICSALNNLGLAAFEQGDYAHAIKLHEESLVLKREIGDKRGIAISLNNLGAVARAQGDFESARSFFSESLVLQRELEDRFGMASSLTGLGDVAIARATEHGNEEVERGARLLGGASAMLEGMGAVQEGGDRRRFERSATDARDHLGEDAFNNAWEEGRAMSVEQVVEYALGGASRVTDALA